MYSQKYIFDFANLIKEKLNISTQLEFCKLKEFIEKIGGSIFLVDDDCFYNSNIKKEGSGFILFLDNSLSDSDKVRFSLVELGHLFLHFKYLDKDFYKNVLECETSYFRYGRAIERKEAFDFANVICSK